MAATVCQTCEKRLGERRRHPRVKRPLNGVLLTLTGEDPPAQVDILEVSESGALIRLKDWIRLHEGQEICLVVYAPCETARRSSPQPVRVVGLIKRIESARWELAIAFVQEAEE